MSFISSLEFCCPFILTSLHIFLDYGADNIRLLSQCRRPNLTPAFSIFYPHDFRAHYHCNTKHRTSKVSFDLVFPTVFLPCTIFYSPCPSRHTLNVLKIIFQSTQKLRSLTYFTSRSIHSSKVSSLRCGAICQ